MTAGPGPDRDELARVRLGAATQQARALARFGLRRALKRKSPLQMAFSLTNRCNFRCDYCEIPLRVIKEMETAQWCRAIDELAAGGMGRASLIGGEPMLRKDLGVIVRHLKKRGIVSGINTNAWYIEDRIEEILPLDLVSISLDGDRESHDGVRRKGSYDRCVRSIELLRSRGRNVVTMSVVTPKTAGSLRHMVELAEAHGTTAYFQLEHDKSCDPTAPISPGISDDGVAAMANELLAMKREGRPVGNSRHFLQRLAADGRRLEGSCSSCWAGYYFGYVFSDGTVAPCLLTRRQQPLENGLKLGFVEAFEAMAQPVGLGCSCVAIQEVNAILSFDINAIWSALEMVA